MNRDLDQAFAKADDYLARLRAGEQAEAGEPLRGAEYRWLSETVGAEEEAEVRRLDAWLADPPAGLRYDYTAALPIVVQLDLTTAFRKAGGGLGACPAVRQRLRALYPWLARTKPAGEVAA